MDVLVHVLQGEKLIHVVAALILVVKHVENIVTRLATTSAPLHVNKLVQTGVDLNVQTAVLLIVKVDAGTLVLVLQMPNLLVVELVTMVVHIAMVPHRMDRVTVHGAVQNVKTAVHLIAA
jgi:hypothetical protein